MVAFIRGFKEGRERKRTKILKSMSYEMANLNKLVRSGRRDSEFLQMQT